MRRFLALLLLAAGSAAGAQGVRVAGTVFDSTAMLPLAGALVQLVPADQPQARARSAQSDSAGRWALDSVPPGRWLATFFHARLDSVGVAANEYLLSVGRPMEGVALTGPSAARVIASRCAASADGPAGALLGRLLDARSGAPRAGGSLAAEWQEFVLGNSGMRRERRTSAAVAGPDGRFALCGLPPDAEVSLSTAEGRDTLVIVLSIPPSGLVARDMYVGAVTARVTGTVRSAEGAPLPGARVSVAGVARPAVADSGGRWALDAVPGGTRVLETRAIGFAPDRRAVDVTATPPPPQDIRLVSLRTLLDTVRVTASGATRALEGFGERRRRLGVGRFMDSTDIQRGRPLRTTHVLERVPGLAIVSAMSDDGRTVRAVRSRGGSGFDATCLPAVFVDNVRIPIDDVDELDALVDITDLAALEVYPAGTTPMAFSTMTGCATVVLWTNRLARRPRR